MARPSSDREVPETPSVGTCWRDDRGPERPDPILSAVGSSLGRMTSVRSKKRVSDHGEVFTPPWLVEAMLDLVKHESQRIDSRFLEPACGSGNFLVDVLSRKLATVEVKFGKGEFEKRHYALFGLMCVYGIELLEDNVAECRANLLQMLAEYLAVDESEDVYRAGAQVLATNIVHGDALTMKTIDGEPITFAEWGYLGKGKFQRRDFRYRTLVRMSSFGDDTQVGDLGKHEIFTPLRSYPPVTIVEMAE
jgi:hypothetical protein